MHPNVYEEMKRILRDLQLQLTHAMTEVAAIRQQFMPSKPLAAPVKLSEPLRRVMSRLAPQKPPRVR